jgi:hypothetical protein
LLGEFLRLERHTGEERRRGRKCRRRVMLSYEFPLASTQQRRMQAAMVRRLWAFVQQTDEDILLEIVKVLAK